MQPRDRQKRVSGNIKQEDCKPDLPVIDVPSPTSQESNTWSRDIKQEATKNYSSLLQQTDKFDGKDFYYRCEMCKKRMPSLKSVMEHRKSVHNIKRTCPLKIKDINSEPDIHDPNFYCKSCKVSYSNRNTYRNHLRAAHYMILKTIPSRRVPESTILPDPDDPNLYCRACDHTYASKKSYKHHCQFGHGMTPVKPANQELASSSIIDSYCKLCNLHLANKASYQSHLSTIHNLDWKLTQQKPKNTVPDVDDPNFYCSACEKKLASKYSFKTHLMRAHAIYQSAPKKTSLQPDIDDPNNYCRACQKNYRTRTLYRSHLRLVHQMTLSPIRASANPGKLPDPNDPHYYCSVCKKSCVTLGKYRAHCKLTHFMVLDHYSILNPNAIIDINHPELYCAQCERSYTDKRTFRAHLRRVHNI
ncbi:hypothetical protein HMPREF1544_06023 [Mucor circinelloides 1006PhL]|uniref:C2H2-type domain-containing protein n=1 Tax=Mucor circinelloides f. circinelloides (strain 1006PhL) TaxID=1220926 RepID=S2JWM0_MUCC1|nr:hypothetical protein HMPREF1544_06023 [Mucor circinelloides 1006PhL]